MFTCVCISRFCKDTEETYLFRDKEWATMWKGKMAGGRLLYVFLILELYEYINIEHT